MRNAIGALVVCALACGDTDTDAGPAQCDADGDGIPSVECAGIDCCDLDPVVPSDGFFSVKNKCESWDYDCNGDDEEQVANFSQCNGSVQEGVYNPPVWLGTFAPRCGVDAKLMTECDCSNPICEAVTTTVSQQCR